MPGRFLRTQYQRVVNIGCGEDYYAVGLALRLPQAQGYAFDSEPRARDLCRALAIASGVEKRVRIQDACTMEALRKALKPGALVLCDCEGCEIELLRPDLLPVLNDCDLLVELYDNNGLNGSAHVLPRFHFSHAMQIIPAVTRTAEDFDRAVGPLLEACGEDKAAELRSLRELEPDQKRDVLDEARQAHMRWACLAAVPVPAVPKTAALSRWKKATVAGTCAPLITGCILARNEARHIEAAIESLRGCADEILVIDNESDDETADIARGCGARVVTAPRGNGNFDGARNLAIEEAAGEWIFYLDADERIPDRLAAVLRRMVEQSGDKFEALQAPFKTYFCGQWMQHCGWWPGYTRCQLLKKGAFHYGERLHSGIEVDGRVRVLPYETAEYAIDHYSYEDIRHYLDKINRYTLGEAEHLKEDGLSHGWQAQLAHFLLDWEDWHVHYDRLQAHHGRCSATTGTKRANSRPLRRSSRAAMSSARTTTTRRARMMRAGGLARDHRRGGAASLRAVRTGAVHDDSRHGRRMADEDKERIDCDLL